MSNVLNEQEKQQVIALGRLGWSLRRIQQRTGVRRETASTYLKAAGIPVQPPGRRTTAKAAISVSPVTTDSEAKAAISIGPVTTDSEPAKAAISIDPVTTDSGAIGPSPPNPLSGSDPTPSASVCEPFRAAIELGLRQGRNAMGIWQDLVSQAGFPAGYQTVKRFVRKLRGAQTPEACAVIVTAPGEEAQVDYGQGPLVRDPQSGKYRHTRLFVMTLGYSRKAVRLLTFRSSSRIWAELHEKAFRRLGGSTRTVVLDNLKEGVLTPDIYDPTLNPLFRDVLAHYAVVALPCRINHPDRKACVSYCTSFLLCDSESWLLSATSSMAFHDRVFVQRFVETALGIVVAVFFQATFSCPEVDCRGRYTVAHTHLFGRKQPLGSQAAVARSQAERLADMRNFL
jgi:hypothetical protein